MSFQYRGIAYERAANSLPTTTLKPIGQYRGAEVVMTIVTDTAYAQPTPALTYRGVRYGTTTPALPIALSPALA